MCTWACETYSVARIVHTQTNAEISYESIFDKLDYSRTSNLHEVISPQDLRTNSKDLNLFYEVFKMVVLVVYSKNMFLILKSFTDHQSMLSILECHGSLPIYLTFCRRAQLFQSFMIQEFIQDGNFYMIFRLINCRLIVLSSLTIWIRNLNCPISGHIHLKELSTITTMQWKLRLIRKKNQLHFQWCLHQSTSFT